jgi:hypothetical protein
MIAKLTLRNFKSVGEQVYDFTRQMRGSELHCNSSGAPRMSCLPNLFKSLLMVSSLEKTSHCLLGRPGAMSVPMYLAWWMASVFCLRTTIHSSNSSEMQKYPCCCFVNWWRFR